MRVLVTGSSGHLGEALVQTLKLSGQTVVGFDLVPGAQTDIVSSINDQYLVAQAMQGVSAVIHTATLHKPHVATHSRQAFIDTNLSGTLMLLEEAVKANVQSFIYTSTTSTFGDALAPPVGEPAAWITEEIMPAPKNIYGVSKAAAEDLCQLFHRNHGLACVVLKTSRFFPEADDSLDRRSSFDDLNLKVNELLYRRVDLHDVVTAHVAALEHAKQIGFDKFIISATSPFLPEDAIQLRTNVVELLKRRVSAFESVYQSRGWRMLGDIDRVYVNARARRLLGWNPEYNFLQAIEALKDQRDPRSPLALSVGFKGYHQGDFADGIYPVMH
jgi:UDP-glucose 4-epimerase